jgi:hypothetical protein
MANQRGCDECCTKSTPDVLEHKAHRGRRDSTLILAATGFVLTVIRDWFIIRGGDHQMKRHARTKKSQRRRA